MMELYYGLPNEIWDKLYFEAEDLLQEEELGQHIVGVYPAGGRIYGMESYPPGLMCLYVDSVESLIDPTSSYHKEEGFKVYEVNNSHSPLYMVDLFKWIRWITTDQTNDWRMEEFLHIIPFGEHIIHEDESISPVLASVKNLLKSQNFKLCGDGPIRNSHKNLAYPFIRAYINLISTGRFKPCLNSEWDEVPNVQIDFYIGINNPTEYDREFISKAISNEKLPELDPFYLEIYPCTRSRHSGLISTIRSQVISLYRYQM